MRIASSPAVARNPNTARQRFQPQNVDPDLPLGKLSISPHAMDSMGIDGSRLTSPPTPLLKREGSKVQSRSNSHNWYIPLDAIDDLVRAVLADLTDETEATSTYAEEKIAV